VASAQFEKYLTLLRQAPAIEHVDHVQMRVALDRTVAGSPTAWSAHP